MWALDFRGWTTADPEVVRVVTDLVAGGTRVALLSNAAPDYGGPFRFSPVGALFEQQLPGRSPEDYLIRVNRQPVARDHALQEGDRVTMTPTKIQGAS